MAGRLTLLGIGAAADAACLAAAMRAIPGPALSVHHGEGLAAFAQAARPGGGGALRGRDRAGIADALGTVQRRLEAACQAAAFLPADPAAATCEAARLPALLEAAGAGLAAALARDGGHHQWDVVLRWPAEAVVRARAAAIAEAAREAGGGAAAMAEAVAAALRQERAGRAAALEQALRPRVLGIANAGMAGGETETGLTVLVPAGGEAAIEAALMALPDAGDPALSADLRGPLPPLSFSAWRVARTDPAAVARAWRLLDLPAQADAEILRRTWRARAARLHPDRDPRAEAGTRLAEAASAHRLLREMAAVLGDEPWTLDAMVRRAGPRLAPPARATPALEE
jgi:hypothetical protein